MKRPSGIQLLQLITPGASRAVPDSAALAALLAQLSRDQSLRQALLLHGVALTALLPAGSGAEEPEWLRAEEMLDEAAACPGERLFAKALGSSVDRPSAAEIATAATSLAEAVRAGALAVQDSAAVLAGCRAVAAAATQLPAALLVEVRLADG